MLQSLFLINGVAIFLWQGSSGLLTRDVGWFALFAFPGWRWARPSATVSTNASITIGFGK